MKENILEEMEIIAEENGYELEGWRKPAYWS